MKTIRIAIVDDHCLVRQGLVTMVRDMPNITVMADVGNGRELLDFIASSVDVPDIVVLDVRMPILDGYDTLRILKKEWPTIKVIMLTMYDSEINMLKFLYAGADGYIVKSDTLKEFGTALITVYNEGLYYPDNLLRKISLAIADKKRNKYIQMTENEYAFLCICCSELTLKEIAVKMNQSFRTVQGYRDTLFKKLNIRSRVGLAIYAIETGIEPIYG
jgi:DNA-binding NarL/FixJ family response regulator